MDETKPETFVCADCGGSFPMSSNSMGMCMGGSPEYWCQNCRPPVSTEEAVKLIKTFMDVNEGLRK